MAFSLDVLLEDDEDLGDSTYDLQDDEENALLEDEIDIPGQCNQEGEEEADVLQLDESDEIVDYGSLFLCVNSVVGKRVFFFRIR